ncbi:MAG: hypothetical protein AAB664_00690 [Patescibacteria group bacterium]
MANQLSQDDRKLVYDLYRLGILTESKLDSLAQALVITDSQCPTPDIAIDTETKPSFTIVNLGGALLLADVSLYEGMEDAADFIRQQIQLLANECNQIVFVAYAPSLAIAESDFTVAEIVATLIQVQKRYIIRCGRKKAFRNVRFHAFFCVDLPEKRSYCYGVNPEKFAPWYRKYEQEVLGRQDDDDPDDLDDGISVRGSFRDSRLHHPR